MGADHGAPAWSSGFVALFRASEPHILGSPREASRNDATGGASSVAEPRLPDGTRARAIGVDLFEVFGYVVRLVVGGAGVPVGTTCLTAPEGSTDISELMHEPSMADELYEVTVVALPVVEGFQAGSVTVAAVEDPELIERRSWSQLAEIVSRP